MATIKYQVKENKTLGTHSFYAQAISFSTLDFNDLAEEVVEGLGITPELVSTILTRYMRVAKRNVLRGHRVKFGDLLTIYPQISCSVKDELNADGTVKTPATVDMLTISQAKGSIGATIAQSVQQSFARSVSWKRVTDPDDDTTTTTDPTPSGEDGNGGNGSGTGENTGGNGGGTGSITPTGDGGGNGGNGGNGGGGYNSGGDDMN